MARSTTRSQAQPSQSQAQPRGTQKRAPRRATEEEEDEEEEEAGEGDGDEEMQQEGGGASDLERRANDLVRLALFTEQRRVPLRRDEISKKVLGKESRGKFNAVFQRAQQILQKTFGMELVELQTRAAANADAPVEGENAQEQQGTGIKKRSVATGSKTYILRSTLHPAIIAAAARADAKILEEEEAAAGGEDGDDDDDDAPRNYGGVLAWGTADQLGAAGVLHVVLALILVSGRVMSDMDLQLQLKRLRLSANAGAQVYLTATSTHRQIAVEAFLQQLIRQGYLDRQRLGEAGAKPKGGKRARGAESQADAEGGQVYEWRWGPRAQAEVGERAVAQFVAEFMVERAVADDDDEQVRGQRAQKRVDGMLKGIERAAGGTLHDVK